MGFHKSGTEVYIHSTSAFLELHPESVLISIDYTAAFQTRSRSLIAQKVFSTPALAGIYDLFHWAYCGPSPLHVYERTGDLFCSIDSLNGVRQGDLLSSISFAVSTQELFTTCNNADTLTLAYIDDLTILGKNLEAAFEAFKVLKENSESENFHINSSKSFIFWPHSHRNRLESIPAKLLQFAAAFGLSIRTDYAPILGSAVSLNHDELSRFAQEKVTKLKPFFDLIQEPCMKSQMAYALLRLCYPSKLSHLARTLPYSVMEAPSKRFDSLILNSLLQKCNISIPDSCSMALKQIVLPLRFSGLGLLSVSTHLASASLASICAALPFIFKNILPDDLREELAEDPSHFMTALPLLWARVCNAHAELSRFSAFQSEHPFLQDDEDSIDTEAGPLVVVDDSPTTHARASHYTAPRTEPRTAAKRTVTIPKSNSIPQTSTTSVSNICNNNTSSTRPKRSHVPPTKLRNALDFSQSEDNYINDDASFNEFVASTARPRGSPPSPLSIDPTSSSSSLVTPSQLNMNAPASKRKRNSLQSSSPGAITLIPDPPPIFSSLPFSSPSTLGAATLQSGNASTSVTLPSSPSSPLSFNTSSSTNDTIKDVRNTPVTRRRKPGARSAVMNREAVSGPSRLHNSRNYRLPAEPLKILSYFFDNPPVPKLQSILTRPVYTMLYSNLISSYDASVKCINLNRINSLIMAGSYSSRFLTAKPLDNPYSQFSNLEFSYLLHFRLGIPIPGSSDDRPKPSPLNDAPDSFNPISSSSSPVSSVPIPSNASGSRVCLLCGKTFEGNYYAHPLICQSAKRAGVTERHDMLVRALADCGRFCDLTVQWAPRPFDHLDKCKHYVPDLGLIDTSPIYADAVITQTDAPSHVKVDITTCLEGEARKKVLKYRDLLYKVDDRSRFFAAAATSHCVFSRSLQQLLWCLACIGSPRRGDIGVRSLHSVMASTLACAIQKGNAHAFITSFRAVDNILKARSSQRVSIPSQKSHEHNLHPISELASDEDESQASLRFSDLDDPMSPSPNNFTPLSEGES